MPPPGFPSGVGSYLESPGLTELQVVSPEEDRKREELRRRRLRRVFGTFFGVLALLILAATCGAYLGQRLLDVPEPTFLGALRTAALAVGLGAVLGTVPLFVWFGKGIEDLFYGGEPDLPNDPAAWFGVCSLLGAGAAPALFFGEQQPRLVPYVLAVCLPITVGGIVLLFRALKPLPLVTSGRKPLGP